MARMIIEQNSQAVNRTNVLKEYFWRYMVNIRGRKASTVKHYYDALNNISKRLKEKNLVADSIYEIMDVEDLAKVRELLYCDQSFIDANKRGNHMYSAGFNNYYAFATAQGFEKVNGRETELDVPIEVEPPEVISQIRWKRSTILREQAICMADYECEIDDTHISFIADKTKKPYMEGHHTIPISFQSEFENSLDVYANIVCLCPLCHKKIHFGMKNDRIYMIHKLYDLRATRLQKCGFDFSRNGFTDIIMKERIV